VPKQFWIVLAFAGLVGLLLHVEWRLHRRRLTAIPIRIHVNGTRGKSSVTRLIASILSQHGIATLAKTTGTTPRLILPDGSEEPIPRHGPPNISETIWAMKRAAKLGARAVVFECMAVNPDLQWVVENRMMQSTVTVITNARLDHTDVQGTSPREIAARFAVPPGRPVVTADPLVAEVLRPQIEALGGTVHEVSAEDVREEDVLEMPYVEHAENLAVAFRVGALLGISRDTAARGMRLATPDSGAASILDLQHEGREWTLVNLFAANDPESTFRAFDTVEALVGESLRPILLFASRDDRGARSMEFASALARNRARFSDVVIWGEKTQAVTRAARGSGFPGDLLVDAGSIEPEELTRLLVGRMNGNTTVLGVGNIVGPAQRWLDHLAQGARPPETHESEAPVAS
jgi:poly-gamma-glutamate synthase PgsB/CapB